MNLKKYIILIILTIFLFSIASVSASDTNETLMTSIDDSPTELSKTDEKVIDQKNMNDKTGAGEGTYEELSNEIGTGGDKNLTKSYYKYTGGNTIEISTPGVINGNGAVIDMNGSNIRAFYVTASGVTIKNLTISNTNINGNGAAIYFKQQGSIANCNFINNQATVSNGGGAIYFEGQGSVTNCNFNNNRATGAFGGGAIYFNGQGDVTNCNFNNNQANSNYGGAIYIKGTGNVTNCNFTNNQLNGAYGGGAVYFRNPGTVTNCNFNNNTANHGGAIYFLNTGTVINCNFNNNTANNGGAIYSLKWATTADTCIFKTSSDTNVNVVTRSPTLNVDNFTSFYGSGEKLIFNLTTNSGMPVTNGNISISVYFKDNGVWVRNYTCLSGEGWIPDLPAGSYIAVFDTEYAEFQKINRTVTITMPNVRYSINVSSVTTNNKTVNITAKTDIPKDILWDGKLLFILPNGTQIEATYGANGTWWAEHTFDACGEYKINATYVGLDNVTINNGTITINKVNSTITLDDIVLDYGETKNVTVTTTGATGITAKIGESDVKVDGFVISIPALDAGTYTLTVTAIADNNHNNVTKNVTIIVNKLKTELTGSAITTTYNINKDLVITLKDSTGKALSGVKVTVNLNGAKTYTTDKNGHVKVSTKGIAPKAYTAKVTFNGDTNYDKSTKDIKVIVKKATPKLTAKKKTFKTTPKTKKYTIVLKDNAGKAIKKAKVTLKVKGKTYKATTNSKGKATFKITKLNKKGTFKATITYKGNKYYNKVSKKANIKVIVTFKTVSKGSKDKATVKEIQQALKDKGYYLTYQGHYLKVDGKFSSCTFRSVKEFQHDKGLKVTGKVDEKTAHKLGII